MQVKILLYLIFLLGGDRAEGKGVCGRLMSPAYETQSMREIRLLRGRLPRKGGGLTGMLQAFCSFYFIFRTNGKSLLYLVLICYLVFKCHKELLLLEMKDMTSLLTESLVTPNENEMLKKLSKLNTAAEPQPVWECQTLRTGTNQHLCETFQYQDNSAPQLDQSALVVFFKQSWQWQHS